MSDKKFYQEVCKTMEYKEKIKQLKKENQKLKEDLEDYERIFDIWNKRKLINKFNKEFSKKTVKEERAKGNKIVGAIPDAEYVYKKYYEKVEQLDLYKSVIDKAIEYIKEFSWYYAKDDGTKGFVIEEEKEETFVNELLEILKGEDNE